MADGIFKLTVEFSTDNAEFDVEDSYEINRILSEIVNKQIFERLETAGKVLDVNGNTIGRWYLGDDYTPVDDATTEINL